MPNWPVDSDPTYLQSFIDANPSQGSTNYANLTNYFRVMSLNQLHLIGDVISVEAPGSAADYGFVGGQSPTYISDAGNRDEATEDVLVNVVDPLVDFRDYDNWTQVGPYNQVNERNGIVDMIMMVWRGKYIDWWAGEASLGGGDDLHLDGVTIKRSYPAGSGLTAQQWPTLTKEEELSVTKHEFAHWLLGSGHPYSGNPEYAKWGMLTNGYVSGKCINAYERERLGWIDVPEISSDVNVVMSDYLTTGDAYKYHPPNGTSNEYFYFENHQQIQTTSNQNPDFDTYDDVSLNPNDLGVFVLHQRGPYQNSENIRTLPSEGMWDWSVPFWIPNPWGDGQLPAFSQDTRNIDGRSHRDRMTFVSDPIGGGWIHGIAGPDQTYSTGLFFRGVGFSDAFEPTIDTLFAPYTNPNTDTWSGNFTDFSMKITGQYGSNLLEHFTLDAPPGPPKNVTLSEGAGSCPYITWDTNTEPDLQHYEVYRRTKPIPGQWGDWTKKTETTNTYWLDSGFHIRRHGTAIAEYYVKAKDIDNNLSNASNKVSTYGDELGIGTLSKRNSNKNTALIPRQYEVEQNTPNPFNPITTIHYQLPEPSMVTLQIFNLRGVQVRKLVNKTQSAGYYTVLWNGTSTSGVSVAAGAYLYVLLATSQNSNHTYRSVHKMVYLK